MQVRGFPTIIFVNGKDGSIAAYTGDRSEADLISYVERRGAAQPPEEDEDEYEDAAHDEL